MQSSRRQRRGDDAELQPMVAEIDWTQKVIIMEKCKDRPPREFYVHMTRRPPPPHLRPLVPYHRLNMIRHFFDLLDNACSVQPVLEILERGVTELHGEVVEVH